MYYRDKKRYLLATIENHQKAVTIKEEQLVILVVAEMTLTQNWVHIRMFYQ